MPFIQTKHDNTSLYYYDWGKGNPVILIHGWPLTSASWEHQARFLAEQGFRVIAYDKRGFGRSDWPFEGFNYDTLAKDLNDLIEQLELSNVTLVGFSMGGGEVARYLGTFGESRVAKAVLIGAVTPFLLKTVDNPDGIEQEVFDEILDKLMTDRPEFIAELSKQFYGYSMMNHAVSTDFLEFFQRMAMSASPRATIELARAWSSTDFRNDLQRISIPTLVMHGTGDSIVPIEKSGRLTAKLITNALLIEYEDEPHGLLSTAYLKLNEDLVNFLNDSSLS